VKYLWFLPSLASTILIWPMVVMAQTEPRITSYPDISIDSVETARAVAAQKNRSKLPPIPAEIKPETTIAQAAILRSWQFDPRRNVLSFTTSQGVRPRVQLIANPVRLVVDLPGVQLNGSPGTQPLVGRAQSLRVGQLDAQTTRIVLELAPGYTWDPQQIKVQGRTANDWSIQLPEPQPIAQTQVDPSQINPADNTGLATIQAVRLDPGSEQLVIEADQPITYQAGWDRETTAYRIQIPGARFSPSISAPNLDQSSPLLQIRLQQDDAQNASIFVIPRSTSRIGQVNQPSAQTLALDLRTISSAAPPTTSPSRPLPQAPRGQIVVVIDPGHGGGDPGAVGIGGLREKDVVIHISRRIAEILQQQGIQVVMTRQDDIELDLEPRVQITTRANANVFVSIHANAISLSRPDVNGLETYYYTGQSLGLAQTVHNRMLSSLPMRDRGVKRARFYVIRQTSIPSILVEVGFVTGQDDAPRLADPRYREQIAEAIARGILEYLQRGR